MGKAIIIPNVDWSGNNLGQVTTSALAILGSSTVNVSGSFSAKAGGVLVDAQWSISDATVATLSSNTGNTVTVTVLTIGTATITATYNGETATMALNCRIGDVITENDFTQEMMGYYYSGTTQFTNTRSVVQLPIVDASTFHGTLKNNSSLIKVAIQLRDSTSGSLSDDSSSPTVNGSTPDKTVWDSKWLTQDGTKSFDYTCNKDNSPGSATSTRTPAYVWLVATYASGTTGMPTLAEIKEAADFSYYYE